MVRLIEPGDLTTMNEKSDIQPEYIMAIPGSSILSGFVQEVNPRWAQFFKKLRVFTHFNHGFTIL